MALKLVLIGLVAGLFSALFGVGGGIVIVPLLILVAGFESRGRDRDVARRDRDHGARGHDPLRVRGPRRRRSRRPRRPARGRRRRRRATGVQQRVSGRAARRSRSPALLAAIAIWLLVDERGHDRPRDRARLRSRACSPASSASAAGSSSCRRSSRSGCRRSSAEATSLLAILPTVAAGTWRQRRYGNVRWRTALLLGVASIAGAVVGVQIATALPEDVLRRLFALFSVGRRRTTRMAGASAAPRILRAMSEHEEIWLPLVDEPIGGIVAQIQADDPEIERLVGSPRRILAFRTFAYIRVGVKLGELLVDNDVPPYDGTENWIELLLREPENRAAIAQEVRAVAEEIAADPRYGDDEQLGPDDGRPRPLPRVRPQSSTRASRRYCPIRLTRKIAPKPRASARRAATDGCSCACGQQVGGAHEEEEAGVDGEQHAEPVLRDREHASRRSPRASGAAASIASQRIARARSPRLAQHEADRVEAVGEVVRDDGDEDEQPRRRSRARTRARSRARR